MNKNIIIPVVVGIAMAGAGFFGGMQFQKSKAINPQNFANLTPEQRQQMFQGRGGQMGGGFAGGRANGGQPGGAGAFTAGEIINKDDKSITVKMPDGGSKIVFYSNTTAVGKTAQGTASDLAVGGQVTITGSANSDGSVTAQNIQIRPNAPQGQ